MAATWIRPLHANKGKTIAKTITEHTDYAENPEKTRKGELVTGYQCSPRTVDAEFLLGKRQYLDITGREQRAHNILAYHIRQSFKPGEVDAETANKIGYELAMRYTKGRHAFIVATHIDKHHIHNHIIFNSTALSCTYKFDEPLRPDRIIRRISDQICLENGLSVIAKPKDSRGHYGTWLGDEKEPSHREKLEMLIDSVLAKITPDYEAFIAQLQAAGCEVKRGKYTSIKAEGQKRYIRLRSLSDDYSDEAIKERIAGKRIVQPKPLRIKSAQTTQPPQTRKVSLLIDIQNSIKAQNSPGYERWAKIFNLKTAASTLLFLQERDLDSIEKLDAKAQQSKDDWGSMSGRIHAIDERLGDISTLQKHIGIYSKTREIYATYRKSGYSKKYLAEHEADITAHKTAKRFFDALKLEKLPSIKTLQTEYTALSAEKKKLYSTYQQVRKEMQEILAAQQNAKSLLGYKDTAAPTKTERS